MSVQGKWLGQWQGSWLGQVGEAAPGAAYALLVGRATFGAAPIVVHAGAVAFAGAGVLVGTATVEIPSGPTVHLASAALGGAGTLEAGAWQQHAAAAIVGGAGRMVALLPEPESTQTWGSGRGKRTDEFWLGQDVSNLPPVLRELAADIQDQADSAISRAARGAGSDPATEAADSAIVRAQRNARVVALLLALLDE
jgi:hypothetical protein